MPPKKGISGLVPEDSIEGRFHVSLSRSEKSSFVSDETNNESVLHFFASFYYLKDHSQKDIEEFKISNSKKDMFTSSQYRFLKGFLSQFYRLLLSIREMNHL